MKPWFVSSLHAPLITYDSPGRMWQVSLGGAAVETAAASVDMSGSEQQHRRQGGKGAGRVTQLVLTQQQRSHNITTLHAGITILDTP